VFPREAAAVAVKAVEQGIAQCQTTYEEEYHRAAFIIKRAREVTQLLMDEGYIPTAE
jgi:malate dehydrogenase (oxaloacetate-decarboxylating)